jgi:hypothetical protein
VCSDEIAGNSALSLNLGVGSACTVDSVLFVPRFLNMGPTHMKRPMNMIANGAPMPIPNLLPSFKPLFEEDVVSIVVVVVILVY